MVTLQERRNGAPAATERVSLVEAGAQWAAQRRTRTKERTGTGVFARATQAISDVFGTFVALACFVIAAFLVGAVLGFAVAGVALLLLDFKASVSRRARTETRAR